MNKKLLIILISTLGLVTGCASTPTATGDLTSGPDAEVVSTSATLIVHGMSCPLCANNVDKQLLAVPGVQSVNVDMGTGKVTVAIGPDSSVTQSQLVKAVHNSGFTLAEMRTP